MMFEDDNEVITCANSLLEVSEKMYKSFSMDSSEYYQNIKMEDFATYGKSRVQVAASKIAGCGYKPEELTALLPQVKAAFSELEVQLGTYGDLFSGLSPEERGEQGKTIEDAISSVYGPLLILQGYLRHHSTLGEGYSKLSTQQTVALSFIPIVREIVQIGHRCASCLVHSVGFAGKQYSRWIIWNLYVDYIFPLQCDTVPKPSIDTIKRDEYIAFLTTLSQDQITLFQFLSLNGTSYLYQIVASWIYEYNNNAGSSDTTLLSTLRNDIFMGIELLLPVLTLMINVMKHPQTDTIQAIQHIAGILTGVVVAISVQETKATKNATAHPYSEYATVLVNSFGWAMKASVASPYKSVAKGSFVEHYLTRYAIVERLLALSPNAKVELMALEPYFDEHFKSEVEGNWFQDWEYKVWGSIKPTYLFASKFPERLPVWSQVSCTMQSAIEYFNIKLQRAIDSPDNDATSSWEDKAMWNPTSPSDLFKHLLKPKVIILKWKY